MMKMILLDRLRRMTLRKARVNLSQIGFAAQGYVDFGLLLGEPSVIIPIEENRVGQFKHRVRRSELMSTSSKESREVLLSDGPQ